MCASFSTSGPSPSTKKREKKLFWPSTQNWQMFELWRDKRQKSGGLFDETGWFRFGWFFCVPTRKMGINERTCFTDSISNTHTRTVAVHMGKKATSSIKLIFVYWISFLFIPLHYSLYINVLRQSFITWNISTLLHKAFISGMETYCLCHTNGLCQHSAY